MTKEELLKAIDELASCGYIKNFTDDELDDRLMSQYSGHQTYLYKVISRSDDEYGASRAVNILQYRIWSFEPYRDRVADESLYSLEPVVTISRTTNERIDLQLDHPKRTIEECETIAEEFGKFCNENIKLNQFNNETKQ